MSSTITRQQKFKNFWQHYFFKNIFQIIESKKPKHTHTTFIILTFSSALLSEISQYLLILWLHISVMMGLGWVGFFFHFWIMLRILAGFKNRNLELLTPECWTSIYKKSSDVDSQSPILTLEPEINSIEVVGFVMPEIVTLLQHCRVTKIPCWPSPLCQIWCFPSLARWGFEPPWPDAAVQPLNDTNPSDSSPDPTGDFPHLLPEEGQVPSAKPSQPKEVFHIQWQLCVSSASVLDGLPASPTGETSF